MELEAVRVDQDVEQEFDRLVAPSAWIGGRDDYDADQRYGGWIELTESPRQVLRSIKSIVDRAPPDLGRQWQICATRGLGGWVPTDREGLPEAINIATGVRAFGEHYGGLASVLGADSPALTYERYQHSYLGSWASERAFVEQIAVDAGWGEKLAELPRQMQPYVFINYPAMIGDAERELTFVGHRNGVWVYDPRVW